MSKPRFDSDANKALIVYKNKCNNKTIDVDNNSG